MRVRSGGRSGAGFVYHSRRHVITVHSLISLGRPITVIARSGERYEASVFARDPNYDIVVLELDREVAGATALEPAPESSAELGRPVVAIGHPFTQAGRALGERGRGLLSWSVTQGTIGAVNDQGIQADLALTDGHAGSPLLDCQGRVLGWVSENGRLSSDLGLVGRIGLADDLIAQEAGGGDFFGDFRLRMGIGGILIIDEDGQTAGGGYLTLGGVLFDRVSWLTRIAYLAGGIGDPGPNELSLSRNLIRIESLLGWRFFVDLGPFNFYIEPSGGVTVNREEVERQSVALSPIADCEVTADETCVDPSIVREREDDWSVRPAVSLSFIFGPIVLAYTLEIDVEEPVETFHALRLGLAF